MTARRPRAALGFREVRLWWYPAALLPIALLIVAPLYGWVPGEVALVGLFLLFFWIFSLGFAIYAKLRKPPVLRQ